VKADYLDDFLSLPLSVSCAFLHSSQTGSPLDLSSFPSPHGRWQIEQITIIGTILSLHLFYILNKGKCQVSLQFEISN